MRNDWIGHARTSWKALIAQKKYARLYSQGGEEKRFGRTSPILIPVGSICHASGSDFDRLTRKRRPPAFFLIETTSESNKDIEDAKK